MRSGLTSQLWRIRRASMTVEFSRAAEAAGWNGYFVWDHIVIADGFPVAEPWAGPRSGP